MIITLDAARRVVALTERAHKLKVMLRQLEGGKGHTTSAAVEFQYGAQYLKMHASKAAHVRIVGIIRNEHELELADCIRQLHGMGAEIPK